MESTTAIFKGKVSVETAKRLETINEIGKIHSVFNRTLNIVLNVQFPNMITIGDSSIAGSPNSVSITNYKQLNKSLKLDQSCLIFSNRVIIDTHSIIHIEPPYTSVMSDSEFMDMMVVETHIEWLKKLLEKKNPYKQQPSYLPFYNQVLIEGQSLSHAIVHRNRKEIERSTKQLIGMGVGLTPSGDDYLTGLLLTLRRWSKQFGFISQAIFMGELNLMTQTNIISQHQLYFALQGEGKQSVVEFIGDFVNDEMAYGEFQKQVQDVLNIGSTSGFDILLGILAGFNIIKRIEGKYE